MNWEPDHLDIDPVRSELTARIFGALSGNSAPDPATIVPMLDEPRRVVLRITPTKAVFQA